MRMSTRVVPALTVFGSLKGGGSCRSTIRQRDLTKKNHVQVGDSSWIKVRRLERSGVL